VTRLPIRPLGALAGAVVLALAAPSLARADALTPHSLHIVGRAAADAPWTDAPTYARKSDRPELAAVVIADEPIPRSRRTRRVYIADDAIRPLSVRGHRVRDGERRSWTALANASIQWSAVEPHAWRERGKEAENGATTRWYSNVSQQRESFGTWLGYDRVTYFETVVAPWSARADGRRRPASARPPRPADDIHGGLGTLRYKAELRVGGRTWSTPGADAVDRYGIKPSVHRVSIRRDDTFLGHLTSYFQVPEIFGSAGGGRNHQTERFVGADCADVLTGAVRRQGFTRVWHTNVASLGTYTTQVAASFAIDAAGATEREIGGVQVGDVIRIDYGGALAGYTHRAWDHVAVLYEDRSDPAGPHRGGADGLLDGFDLVVHMGHPRLVIEPLSSQAPATLDVLRWSPRKMRRR
jgi:hypothetical protein